MSAPALAAAWAQLDRCCGAGIPVVVDGTHCQRERREAVRAVAAAHGRGTVLVVVLESLPVCLARQQQRARRVPGADVARQHAAVLAALPGLPGEGHTAVLVLSAGRVRELHECTARHRDSSRLGQDRT